MKKDENASGVTKNFTLIELLVVIAIIAILAAILLPTLQSAKARSQTASCVANIKNLTSASASYSGDNEDYFVPYQMDAATQKPPSGKFLNSDTWYYNDFLHPYLVQSTDVSSNSVYLCPEVAHADKQRFAEGILTMNYGWNQDVHLWINRTSETLPVRKIGEARNPSKLGSVMDAGRHRVNWQMANLNNSKIEKYSYLPGFISNSATKFSGQKSLNDAVRGRHPGKTINVGYADGHVQSVRTDDLAVKTYYSNAGGNNWEFWHPKTTDSVIKFK